MDCSVRNINKVSIQMMTLARTLFIELNSLTKNYNCYDGNWDNFRQTFYALFTCCCEEGL